MSHSRRKDTTPRQTGNLLPPVRRVWGLVCSALQKVLEQRVARLRELATSKSQERLVWKIEKALHREQLSKIARVAVELAEKADGELEPEAAALAALLQ